MHKMALFSSGFIFRTSLFFGLTLLAAVLVLGNRETPKQALTEADAYTRYVQAVIDSGKQQSQYNPSSIPLDDPQIELILKQSLSENKLQEISEGVIDASYTWLNGETSQLVYSYDVTENKELLARGVSDYAIERLILLPPCSEPPEEQNIFKVNCYPQNIDIASIRSQIYQAILEDTSIWPANTITQDNLPKSGGKSITELYANAPRYYSIFTISPWLLLGLAAISMASVIRLSRNSKRGFHGIATSVIGTGIFLAVAPLIYIVLFPSSGLSLPGIDQSGNESIGAISNDVMKHIYSDFNTMLLNIAIQVIVVGIALYVVSRFMLVKKPPYGGIAQKSGLVTSVDRTHAKVSPVIKSADIPIQTSEKVRKPKRKMSDIEKKFQKL